MGPKWKNFFLLAVVSFTILFVVFFLTQTKLGAVQKEESFLGLYDKFSVAWRSVGVKASRLHDAYSELEGLSDENLEKLKLNLSGYKSGDDERIALLARAYTDFVGFVVEERENRAALGVVKVSHNKSPCETVGFYERLNASTERLVSLATAYSAGLDSFVSKYPVEAKQISLKKFEFDEAGALKLLAKQRAAVDYFRGACKK